MNPMKNLGAAVLLQAVKDYFNETTVRQEIIIKDLKSDWLDFLTNGMSTVVAEQLILNPEQIKNRLGGNYCA